MKKLVSLVLSLILVLSLAAFANATSEPLVINFWHTGGSGALQEAVDMPLKNSTPPSAPKKTLKSLTPISAATTR